jgi:ABC-type molybdate transport system substrate-binding protein
MLATRELLSGCAKWNAEGEPTFYVLHVCRRGTNISQAAQFVHSGNVDAGVLALSLVVAPVMKDAGRYFEIPASEYPMIEQAAIVLASSKNKDTVRLFIDFLKNPPRSRNC